MHVPVGFLRRGLATRIGSSSSLRSAQDRRVKLFQDTSAEASLRAPANTTSTINSIESSKAANSADPALAALRASLSRVSSREFATACVTASAVGESPFARHLRSLRDMQDEERRLIDREILIAGDMALPDPPKATDSGKSPAEALGEVHQTTMVKGIAGLFSAEVRAGRVDKAAAANLAARNRCEKLLQRIQAALIEDIEASSSAEEARGKWAFAESFSSTFSLYLDWVFSGEDVTLSEYVEKDQVETRERAEMEASGQRGGALTWLATPFESPADHVPFVGFPVRLRWTGLGSAFSPAPEYNLGEASKVVLKLSVPDLRLPERARERFLELVGRRYIISSTKK